MNKTLLFPVGSVLELLGALTLITNEGTFAPQVELGFNVPALIPADIQGVLLLLAGAGITFYSIMDMA
ncbi:hypothetical protein [Candidatus Nanohalococcus occultus]|uniref:hypothetical protein n=1 Tax=Candidatus Nanohalococcus occultus TaxID=2978047 RepID=UPI0039E0FB57